MTGFCPRLARLQKRTVFPLPGGLPTPIVRRCICSPGWFREIDGYWLFPDNRILSAASLRELFRYAATHGVEVAVFNDALLKLGASISSEPSPRDIAAQVAGVAEAMVRDGGESMPAVTPLTEVQVKTRDQAIQRASSDRLAQSP